MGHLNHWPVGKLMKKHRLDFFVETGLFKGAGLRRALFFPFRHCYSIEASAQFIADFQSKASDRGRYTLVHGDSAEVLPDVLDKVDGPAFFWLDAHYPHRYMNDQVVDLPLLAEVQEIVGHRTRDYRGDVILADDTRIYGVETAAGPLPGGLGLRHGSPEELQRIVDMLEITHDVQLDRREGGYLLATPRVDKVAQQG